MGSFGKNGRPAHMSRSGIKTGLKEDAQQFKLPTRKGASRNGGWLVLEKERRCLYHQHWG